MKRIIILISWICLTTLLFAQSNEPGINEFISVDEEPQPQNLMDIRQSVGYPEEAMDKEISGYVVARVLVGESGEYLKHKIIREADSLLGNAVRKQLPKLTFTPAKKDGKVVKYWVNIPFNFQLAPPSEESKSKAVIRALTLEIEKAPEDYELLVKRGVQYRNIEDHDNAIADFEKSISLNPKKNKKKTSSYPYLYYAHMGLGKSDMALSKWDDALKHFTKAIEVANTSKNRDSAFVSSIATAYIERGVVHAKLEKYSEALTDYEWVIKNSEINRCLVYSLKYDLAMTQKNYSMVVNCLDEIIKCEPENHTLFFNRGYYKIETQDYESAIEDFDKVLKTSQNYLLRIAAHNRKSLCYKNMKKYDMALVEVEKAHQINVLHPQAYFYKGMILLETGKETEGCESIQKAIDFGLEGEDKEKADDLLVHNCK